MASQRVAVAERAPNSSELLNGQPSAWRRSALSAFTGTALVLLKLWLNSLLVRSRLSNAEKESF